MIAGKRAIKKSSKKFIEGAPHAYRKHIFVSVKNHCRVVRTNIPDIQKHTLIRPYNFSKSDGKILNRELSGFHEGRQTITDLKNK